MTPLTVRPQTGAFMESHLDRLLSCVLSLSLLIHLSLAAPGMPGTQREESLDAHPPSVALPNPFGSGEDERRFLESYIQSSVKNDQRGPEINTWEQEVFFLFGLYDYDRSGLLDGLEMMKLLSDYSSHHRPGAQANEQVVSMVDFLLQTQDLNQDGLLAPSELLSPPMAHTLDSGKNNARHPEQEVEEKLPNADEENAGAVEQRVEETQNEIQPLAEEEPQQEVKTEEEEEAIKQIDAHEGQEIPEALAADLEQHRQVPVHQGQPEI